MPVRDHLRAIFFVGGMHISCVCVMYMASCTQPSAQSSQSSQSSLQQLESKKSVDSTDSKKTTIAMADRVSSALEAIPATFSSLTLKRSDLERSHINALLEDGGVVDGRFLSSTNRFVLLGRRSLWLYDFVDKRLHKFSFAGGMEASKETSALYDFVPESVLVKLARRALIVSYNPKIQVKQLRREVHASGMIGDEGVLVADGSVFFMPQNLRRKRTLPMPQLPKSVADKENVRFAVAHDAIWLYTSTQIFSWQPYNSEVMGWRQIVKKMRSIQKVDFFARRMLVRTPYSLVAMYLDGTIENTIPVLSKRKLVDMHVDKRGHMYIFDDFQMEYYDILQKRRSYYKFALLESQKHVRFRVRYPHIAVLASGSVVFYEVQKSQSSLMVDNEVVPAKENL